MIDSENYDYIVVGGGSAGCVTANRLVSDHNARVLLLEAGVADEHPFIKMPAGTFKIMLGNTPFLKRYESDEQPTLGSRKLTISQASVLGGGSSVNVMAYVRGSKTDYERWAQVTGGAWSWDNLLPIFKRQEGNCRFDNASHGGDGPLKIDNPIASPKCSALFVRTLQRLGLDYRDDFNTGELTGVGFLQATMHEAQRCSAADAFIKPIANDPRLTLRTSAEVNRVLVEQGRAVGVEYNFKGKARSAAADKEIILTAGALVTPKILMLSGIGPRDHLLDKNIECLVDSQGVGRNLQDHCITSLTATINGPYGFFGQERGIRAVINYLRYKAFRDGPVASNGADVWAFLNLDDSSAEPDIQLYCLPIMWATGDETPATHGITLMAGLLRPNSRGRVQLQSSNPQAPMSIDLNWLSDPEDERRMLQALKYMRSVIAAQPLASIVTEERSPGIHASSDSDLLNHLRASLQTNHHPAGTCKMGADDDPLAVLTPDLRVRGVEGLRVFDASIMPEVVSANTNAAVMAIAERGVELMMDGR